MTCGAGFCAGTSGWAGGAVCEPAGSMPAHAEALAGGQGAGVNVHVPPPNAGSCWPGCGPQAGGPIGAEACELAALAEVDTLAMSTRPSESACRRLRICPGLSSRTCSLSVLAGWLSKNCQALAAMMSQGERLRGSASVRGEVCEAAHDEAKSRLRGMRIGVAMKTRAGL